MGMIKDLTNQRFGKLTVLEITPERKNRQVVWKCQCDCGNITYVVGQALRTGHTKSCGCGNYDSRNIIDIQYEQFGELKALKRSDKKDQSKSVYWTCQCSCGQIEDILGTKLRNGEITKCSKCRKQEFLLNPTHNHLGEKFGLLTVIAPTEKRSAGKIIWQCQCDCGTICEVSSNALVSGNTNSCGCLRNSSLGESLIEQYFKFNHINYKKQITFNDCRSSKGAVLRFDFGIYDAHNELKGMLEYDGIQHFSPIEYFGGTEVFDYLQICDHIKNTYANNNNIPLFRISYLHINEIHNILESIINNLL